MMKQTRAQKKAKMQAAAEALIEQLLDWDEQNTRPNMTAIEDELLKVRQQFGKELAEIVVEGQENRQLVENAVCPTCGKPMRYKGEKHKAVGSRLGGVEIERGYYYCNACKSGSFPPGRTT
jgi:DNA repair exonuclease SbcCD ATPase subunit